MCLRLCLPVFAKTLVRRYLLKNEDILIERLKAFRYNYHLSGARRRI